MLKTYVKCINVSFVVNDVQRLKLHDVLQPARASVPMLKACLDRNQRQPCSMTTQTEIQFSADKLTNLNII